MSKKVKKQQKTSIVGKNTKANGTDEYYLTKAIDTVQTAAGYEKKINILEDENVKTEMLKYF